MSSVKPFDITESGFLFALVLLGMLVKDILHIYNPDLVEVSGVLFLGGILFNRYSSFLIHFADSFATSVLFDSLELAAAFLVSKTSIGSSFVAAGEAYKNFSFLESIRLCSCDVSL